MGVRHTSEGAQALDGLRGMAVLWVVAFHILRWIYPAAPFTIVGEAAIPVFYVLSGYVLEINYGGQKWALLGESGCGRAFVSFMVRRVARLYPTYVLCNMLAVPFQLIIAGPHPCALCWRADTLSVVIWLLALTNWLPHFVTSRWLSLEIAVTPLGASWTISAFFCLYTVFPVLSCALHVLAPKPPKPLAPRLTAVAVGCSAIYLLLGVLALQCGVPGDVYASGLCGIPCLLIGCCAGRIRCPAQHYDGSPGNCKREGSTKACTYADARAVPFIGVLLIGSIASSVVFKDHTHHDWYITFRFLTVWLVPHPAFELLLVLTEPGAARGLFDAWVLRSQMAQFLGRVSMALYLLHTIPLSYLDLLFVQRSALYTILCIASPVISIPAAWFVTERFETPIGRAIVSALDPIHRSRAML